MDLEKRIENLTKETIELRREILTMKAIMLQQNKIIRELTSTSDERDLVQPHFDDFDTTPPHLNFPIKTQEDLYEFETSINDENREESINTIKRMTKFGGLVKNFKRVMSDELCMQYNLTGVSNKRSLQDFPNYLNCLYKALDKPGFSEKQFIKIMRQALKQSKTRYLKKASVQRKKKLAAEAKEKSTQEEAGAEDGESTSEHQEEDDDNSEDEDSEELQSDDSS